MHQDQRIGLALGVLLVGACAAFFFRNEARPARPLPRLQNAHELDDRIAERSTRPYLHGVDAVEAADRRCARAVAEPSAETPMSIARGADPFEASSVQLTNENSSREKPRARLIGPVDDVQELGPIAIPNDIATATDPAHDDDSAANNIESVPRRSATKPTSTGERSHVVQRGETLSSIAGKLLGSQNRFHEIFEANRDQLSDPNDLKLGMTLRIPDLSQVHAHKPSSTNVRLVPDQDNLGSEAATRDSSNDFVPPPSDVRPAETPVDGRSSPSSLLPPELPNDLPLDAPSETLPTDEPTPGKKFVPARRMQPPPARPSGPQVYNNRARELSGRKLSQASLESTSGKVAR